MSLCIEVEESREAAACCNLPLAQSSKSVQTSYVAVHDIVVSWNPQRTDFETSLSTLPAPETMSWSRTDLAFRPRRGKGILAYAWKSKASEGSRDILVCHFFPISHFKDDVRVS